MTERQLDQEMIRLRTEVENHLGWGSSAGWHSKMFKELSEKIYDSSQVMLSVTTLKRFFGVVNYEGTPSITTLDALSQFVGQENWRAFKTHPKSQPKKKFKAPKISAYVTVGFFLAFVIVTLIGTQNPSIVIKSSEFAFSSKVLSREFPNSVVFDFEIPQDLRLDSLKIQQYWDPRKTVSIH